MKQLSICLVLLAVIVSSCQKSHDVSLSNTVVPAVPKPPTADFKITNSTDGVVKEANILDFANNSDNAVSYYWDFGNGITSTEKIPSNFFFGTCGMSYTVTLTVKDASGQAATHSESYFVMCIRGGTAHAPITTPTHTP